MFDTSEPSASPGDTTTTASLGDATESLLEQLRALRPKLLEEERLRQDAERALTQERNALENLVLARTAELEAAYRAEGEANRRLRVAERRLRVLIRTTAQIVWIADAAGNILEAEGWTEFTGQSLADMQAGRFADVLHPDECQLVLDAWHASVAYGGPYIIEHRLRRRDGVYETFSVRGVPLLDESGKIVEYIGMTTNLKWREARPLDSVMINGQEVAGVIVPELTEHPTHAMTSHSLPAAALVETGVEAGLVETGVEAGLVEGASL